MIHGYENSEIFMVHGLNPEPWKAPKSGKFGGTKDGKLSDYQLALREALRDKYTAKDRQWPEGPLRIRFFFRRSTSDGQPCDRSNLVKSTEDAVQRNARLKTQEAIEGILTGDDKHNHRVEVEMAIQGPNVTPMIIIAIEPYRPSQVLIDLERAFDAEASATILPPQEVESIEF